MCGVEFLGRVCGVEGVCARKKGPRGVHGAGAGLARPLSQPRGRGGGVSGAESDGHGTGGGGVRGSGPEGKDVWAGLRAWATARA